MPDTPTARPDAIVILTTASGEEQATRIARHLVENRWVACVNLIPRIRSVYQWKGKMAQDEEVLMIIKTRREMFERVRQAIRELHSYELPEVLALDVCNGDPDVLAWIRQSTPTA